jgi:hypothetical protein
MTKSSVLLAAGLLAATFCPADEGMWLFNQPPRELLKERYQFEIADPWLDHLQRSSVRFNSGGSGSFISEDGLLISNHHVGADALQKLSSKERDLLRDGFYARTPAEELKCLDLELNVLESIEDVTARVNEAVPADADASKAFELRRKVIAEIEKSSLENTGLRSDVVTLWQGGAYHLYRYKRYTDVRLVFAPEQQIAFFGGDPDNFEFPRYDLDICLFRAYEDGKPAKVNNYLRFSPKGPREGDLVFVTGHPGGTRRLLTVAELENLRDLVVPFRLQMLNRREVLLNSWSERSPENARRAKDLLFGVQNSRKALNGNIGGLLDPTLMSAKERAEAEFKSKLQDKAEYADALKSFDKIAETIQADAPKFVRTFLIERAAGFACDSFEIARTLLRAAEERPKPNGERLQEFSEARKESLELDLFSEMPIYTDLEIVRLADSFTLLAAELGAEDPLVKAVLEGKSPRERAAELINGTKVRDVAFRKRLYAGGSNEVTAAADALIELARRVDGEARTLRRAAEESGETLKQAHAALARARNAVYGTTSYPDATFTLRLAFGTVKGWEQDGKPVPAFTEIRGLYERAKEMVYKPPFDLPRIWEERKGQLDLDTHFNFVSTCDIIGGNSGSPVVDREGRFVGIIFDGNLPSLAWDYAYEDRQGRAISVDSAAMLEALKKVYGADQLADELVTGRRQSGS